MDIEFNILLDTNTYSDNDSLRDNIFDVNKEEAFHFPNTIIIQWTRNVNENEMCVAMIASDELKGTGYENRKPLYLSKLEPNLYKYRCYIHWIFITFVAGQSFVRDLPNCSLPPSIFDSKMKLLILTVLFASCMASSIIVRYFFFQNLINCY